MCDRGEDVIELYWKVSPTKHCMEDEYDSALQRLHEMIEQRPRIIVPVGLVPRVAKASWDLLVFFVK